MPNTPQAVPRISHMHHGLLMEFRDALHEHIEQIRAKKVLTGT
jgi:hypothetical protein